MPTVHGGVPAGTSPALVLVPMAPTPGPHTQELARQCLLKRIDRVSVPSNGSPDRARQVLAGIPGSAGGTPCLVPR